MKNNFFTEAKTQKYGSLNFPVYTTVSSDSIFLWRLSVVLFEEPAMILVGTQFLCSPCLYFLLVENHVVLFSTNLLLNTNMNVGIESCVSVWL